MSLRPPSLINTYDEFFSEDPAIIPFPAAVDDQGKDVPPAELEKARAEWRQKIKVARDTGDWKPVTIEGATPTRFEMKIISGTQLRELVGQLQDSKIGGPLFQQLMFRAAFVAVHDPALGDGPNKHKPIVVPGLGKISAPSVADYFDSICPRIVSELGDEVYRRARELDPKS